MNTKQLIAPDSIFTFTISKEDIGNRIDKYITAQFPLYSRTFFNRLIDDGYVRLNNKIVTKSSTPVQEGDTITLQFPPNRHVGISRFRGVPPVEILFEHPHFFIIFKPATLLVHPPSMASTDPTLVDWLLAHIGDIKNVGYVDRPGIVHRLDKDTSGLLIIPRTNYAHGVFGDMFRERSIDKTYYALVEGHPPLAGTITAPIGRCPIAKTKMTTASHPSLKKRDAITHYRTVEYFDTAALLEVKPITGRTHQIRVHLASIKHPIIGDRVYGKQSKHINRQALHAAQLAFQFEGKTYTFSKELPEDFQNIIKKLRA